MTIDTVTIDRVEFAGFDAAAKEKAASLTRSFRSYIEEHKAEIAALQILYSRPYAQRLTEAMLKDLEARLKQEPTFGPDPVTTLWRAFEQTQPVPTEHPEHPEKKSVPAAYLSSVDAVGKKSGIRRFADLVSLVRFALEQQPVLEPFANSVHARFDSWLRAKDEAAAKESPLERGGAQRRGVSAFTPDQLSWLHLIRDHIATSLAIEPDDFGYAPFAQRGGLGRAHQLFGEQLPKLLDELNETLAA